MTDRDPIAYRRIARVCAVLDVCDCVRASYIRRACRCLVSCVVCLNTLLWFAAEHRRRGKARCGGICFTKWCQSSPPTPVDSTPPDQQTKTRRKLGKLPCLRSYVERLRDCYDGHRAHLRRAARARKIRLVLRITATLATEELKRTCAVDYRAAAASTFERSGVCVL